MIKWNLIPKLCSYETAKENNKVYPFVLYLLLYIY